MNTNPKPNCKIIVGTVHIATVSEFLAVLSQIAQNYAVTIQAMDATLIASEDHIKSAVDKAVRVVANNQSITSDLGLEILLYALGRRQIGRALAMGVTEGDKEVAVVIVDAEGGKDLEVVAEDVKRETGIVEVPLQDLEVDHNNDKREHLKRFFAITEAELNAVGEEKLKLLVLERVALLDVLK
jgi:KEOPS complex subunit Cgi121